MKKFWTVLVLFSILSFSLAAQLHLDVSPGLWLDSAPNIDETGVPTLEDLHDWYSRPATMVLSLDLSKDDFRLYMQAEARTDLMADLTKQGWGNLFFETDGSFYIDPNLPQIGYAEYRSDFLTISAGRRKLKWGPGFYGLGISDASPYFDHLWFETNFPVKNGSWEYNFILITSDTRASENQMTIEERDNYSTGYKTLAAHRISYLWPRVRFSLMDYNLVYGRVPDLQEMAPFVHYHSLYQREQNVMLGLAVEGLGGTRFRWYGELVIDDFQTSIESGDSNPGGVGAILGGQLILMEGDKSLTLQSGTGGHSLTEKSFSLGGKLILTWEQMWTSEYMYNRAVSLGKFTNPLYYMWMYKPKIVTAYYGAAYGPDRLVERLTLQYNKHPVNGEFLFEYHRIGGHGINGSYEPPFDNWLTLGTPVQNQFRVGLAGNWNYRKNRSIYADIKIDFGSTNRIQAGAGWNLNLF